MLFYVKLFLYISLYISLQIRNVLRLCYLNEVDADHRILQQDIFNLLKKASAWGMKLMLKCDHSINTRSSHFYTVDDHILKQALGITISDGLRWGTYIYLALIRSMLGYVSVVWDFYQMCDTDRRERERERESERASERVQRSTAMFIRRDYKSRLEGCVPTKILT